MPRTPDPSARTEVARRITAVVEPLQRSIEASREVREESQAFLAEKRSRGLDPETKELFARAAEAPGAPDSVRKVGQEVAAGRMTWDDVFSGRGGELGSAFLADAFSTAQARFGDEPVTPVEVPDEALEQDVDPVQVDAEVDRMLREGREAHDAVWRTAFE